MLNPGKIIARKDTAGQPSSNIQPEPMMSTRGPGPKLSEMAEERQKQRTEFISSEVR
jgi:hypothetical protein